MNAEDKEINAGVDVTQGTAHRRWLGFDRVLLMAILVSQVGLWIRMDRFDRAHRVGDGAMSSARTNDAAARPETINVSRRHVELPTTFREEGEWLGFPPGPSHLDRFGDVARQMHLMEDTLARMGGMGAFFNLDRDWDGATIAPAMDMREQDDRYIVTFSLPGADPQGLEVTLDGRLLMVSASAAQSADGGERVYRFERRVQLPGPVADVQSAQAVLTNGLLRISIPKSPRSQTTGGRARLL